MKIVTVIGARPQFVKAAALSRYLKTNSQIQEIIVHTGQHYDKNMSDIFFQELDIPSPQFHLNVGSGSHAVQTGDIMKSLEKILVEVKPDVLLVYGDTNSTLAGAITATKMHIPVAHVEAGLRSFNMFMPEEQNRLLTDHIASYLFCPTDLAIANLQKENIFDQKPGKYLHHKNLVVKNTGDIMYDAVLFYTEMSKKQSAILKQLSLNQGEYLLSTIHRAENTDDPQRLQSIFSAFKTISKKIILTLHPRTKKYISQYNIKIPANVTIIEPVGYLDMINLESNASVIITDSGGIQKEAFFLKVPCITMRDETEWLETVSAGWNFITSADEEKILDSYNIIENDFNPNKNLSRIFGDGNAAENIIKYLIA